MNKYTKEEIDFISKFKDRLDKMQSARQNVFGVNMEEVWKDADEKYIPHQLKTKGSKIIVSDDDLGLRGRVVELGKDNWQHDESLAYPYAKLQTALSILIDRNPGAVFKPGAEKYIATTPLMEGLYYRNWKLQKANEGF